MRSIARSLPLLAVGLSLVPAGTAYAGQTPVALLVCNSGMTVSVTGFGRGTPLKVAGSTSNFVVKSASTGGQVLLDLPITGNKDAVTCTTTSPMSGIAYTFRGFFTPAGA